MSVQTNSRSGQTSPRRTKGYGGSSRTRRRRRSRSRSRLSLYERICHYLSMHPQCDYEGLAEAFDEAALPRHLKGIMHDNLTRMTQLFGKVASNRRIVLDVCFPETIEAIRHVHLNFGMPLLSRLFMGHNGKSCHGAPDREIIERSTCEGIAAILTCDGSLRKPSDMCRVITQEYEAFDPTERTHQMPPAVVIFPRDREVVEGRLEEDRERILHYLEHHPERVKGGHGFVLDLRLVA